MQVLGVIKDPRRNLPRAMWWGMGLVSVLYLAVNICYVSIIVTGFWVEAFADRG